MFITGYGAYEISSDPGFAVSRISMLDRGVLYAVPHIRGGGEMGRAWYEQGTCSTRSIRLRISSTPRARCNAPDWPRRCVRWRTAARRAAY